MDDYIRWLRAAYLYYIQPGDDTGMSDAEWDYLSRKFYAARDQMTEPEHAPLHRAEFDGGSLFWLRGDEYPACAQPTGEATPLAVPQSPLYALPTDPTPEMLDWTLTHNAGAQATARGE